MFFGFSPFLGLHTILGLAFAFALNLNRVAALLGVYSNLPWILVPYYSLATWLGAALIGLDVPPGVAVALVHALKDRSWADFSQALSNLKPFVRAFTVGSTIGSIVLAATAYRASFLMIVMHRKHLHHPQDAEM